MPRIERNVAGRDFAVGGIHGCFGYLVHSLEAIGFDEGVDRLLSVAFFGVGVVAAVLSQ